MIDLLRKDRHWMLALTIAGTAALSIAYVQEHFLRTWVFPPKHMEGVYCTLWIQALVLGTFAGLRDETTGTRDYLEHRPIAPTRIHAIKVLGCAAVVCAWLVLSPAIHWATTALFDRELIEFGSLTYLPQHLALGCVAFSCFALALFASSLPAHWHVRTLVGACATLTVLSVGLICSTDEVGTSPLAFALFHLGVATLFCAASFRHVGERADQDVPWSARTRAWSGALGTTAFLGAATLGISGLQDEFNWSLRVAQPRVIRTPEGRFALGIDERRGRSEGWQVVDRKHHRTGERISSGKPIAPTWMHFGPYGWFGLDAPRPNPRSDVNTDAFRAEVIFSTGKAHIGWSDHWFQTPTAIEIVDRGPDGERFTPDARVLRTRSKSVWIVDERQLWRLDRDHSQPWFERVELPGGDSLIENRMVEVEDDRPQGVLNFYGSREAALIGAQDVYVIGSEIEPAPASVRAQIATDTRSHRVERVDRDVITPHVRVIEDDAIAFEHVYELQTGAERLHGGVVLGLSTLRSPLLQIASALRGSDPMHFAHQPFFDPLVAGGRRWWLVITSIVISLLSALWLRATLRKRDVPATARRFWIANTLALGPVTPLLALLIERRRAHTTFKLADPVRPLIRSA